jgi:hypothetical protein
MISGVIMPVPTVWATFRPKNRKATKLKKAAQNTAYCGGRTRVETIVAMEFAASCRPLSKSNAKATPISPMRSAVSIPTPLNVLDHDVGHPVRHILKPIDDLFEMAIDFSSNYERHGVGIAMRAEKSAQPLVVEFIGLVLHAQNFFAEGIQPARVVMHGPQKRNRALGEFGGLNNNVAHAAHRGLEVAYFVKECRLAV